MGISINNVNENDSNIAPAGIQTGSTPANGTTMASSYTPSTGGLTAEEQSDPNKIIVTIADQDTPIVVLFGPPSCGKTMTLVRLTRFLQSEGYTVAPVRSFRPSSDLHYTRMCDEFDMLINSNDAANSTSLISFMLVEVLKNGRPVCMLLEAPGEHYFDPTHPNAQFPTYVYSIISCKNRKVWGVFVEPEWTHSCPRANYVTKINLLKQSMKATDKVLFVYNKIDKTTLVHGAGRVHTGEAIRQVANLYPNIFVPFLNQNPITKFFKQYNCEFVPFQTGFYTETLNGFTYIEGPNEYPRMLWQQIQARLRG